jgi:hypothetical protein
LLNEAAEVSFLAAFFELCLIVNLPLAVSAFAAAVAAVSAFAALAVSFLAVLFFAASRLSALIRYW